MDDKQYVIEREYLGKSSVREFITKIIQSHIDNSRRYRESNYEKTVEKSINA